MDVSAPTTSAARKRVLFVITKANWGGAQRYVYDLACAAQGAGNEVLVAHGTNGGLAERLQEAGIATTHIGTLEREIGLGKEFRSYDTIAKLIRSWEPDVVHGNSSKAGTLAAFAGRLHKVPRIIFTAHGWAWNSSWRSPLLRGIACVAHYVTVLLSHTTICVSDALRREASWMPFVQDRFQVIHNGIEPRELMNKDEARAALFPQGSAPLLICTVGELHPTKGHDVLIAAFALIATRFSESGLAIVGGGELREELEAQIEKTGLSGRIHLLGHIPDAPAFLSAFDIFAFPSRSEALGFALLEAGMARLPAVGTNIGGIPEIIKDRENGLLVPVESTEALAEALALLLENEVLRKNLGDALYERVVRVFPKDRMVRETLALYSPPNG